MVHGKPALHGLFPMLASAIALAVVICAISVLVMEERAVPEELSKALVVSGVPAGDYPPALDATPPEKVLLRSMSGDCIFSGVQQWREKPPTLFESAMRSLFGGRLRWAWGGASRWAWHVHLTEKVCEDREGRETHWNTDYEIDRRQPLKTGQTFPVWFGYPGKQG